MSPSPVARQLVVHHDDLGANHATNRAFVELFDLGICTAGSVMVPCPWFSEIVAIARDRPDLDLGIHLTLTAEFEHYRWRPLTGVSSEGLTDPDGCFWPASRQVRTAGRAAVERELRAQIDTGLASGIDPTHLDAHMGAPQLPEFIDLYLDLGREYQLPVVLPRNIIEMAPPGTSGPGDAAAYAPAFERLAAEGHPAVDKLLLTAFGNAGDTAAAYRALFESCAPGLTYGAFHFNPPGEIEHYSADAPIRIAEYELFRSGQAKAMLDDLGIELVGMRGFRDALRARPDLDP